MEAMSPEGTNPESEEKGAGNKSENRREKIHVEGGKESLEKVRKGERICPFWVHESVIDIWRPQKEKEEVNFCMATHRMTCLKDYRNYDNCEYYLQFKKSDEENTPPSINHPRYGVKPLPEDAY